MGLPGVTLVYGLFNDGDSSIPVAAMIEYGAVEKFSGYSSVGDNYQISLVGLNSYADPATYYKFQIRLLKRMKDVYVGVGLRNTWQVVDNLNALVGGAVSDGPKRTRSKASLLKPHKRTGRVCSPRPCDILAWRLWLSTW
jgi:hypothetical protein